MVKYQYTLVQDEGKTAPRGWEEPGAMAGFRSRASRWCLHLTPCKMVTVLVLFLVFLAFIAPIPSDVTATLLPIQCHGTTPSFAGKSTNIACQIEKAKALYEENVKRQSRTEEDAIAHYRLRYKREPPSRFAEWFRFAMENNATTIDDFDVLERDLAQFKGLSPERMKLRTDNAIKAGNADFIRITKGVANGVGQEELQKLIKSIESKLPDLMLPLNGADEPRIVGHQMPAETGSDDVVYGDAVKESISAQITVEQCNSTYKQSLAAKQGSPSIQHAWLDDSKDLCLHPELRTMHGFLQAPSYLVYSRTLFPIVGMSKLSTFGDFLAPPKCYFADFYRTYKDPDTLPFAEKIPTLYWRGSSTGVLPQNDKWKMGHRQRVVSFTKNLIERLLKEKYELLKSPAWRERLKPWQVDVKISSYVHCPTEICNQEKESLGIASEFAKSNESFKYKYALDIDGNGMSCRYYRLLESNSVVFKQTIHREWHDERLVPWLHFVPLSMDMQELPSLMEFFANSQSGEKYGELISAASRDYAKHSLRTVDFAIYWYRFLIEYARLFPETQ